MYKTLAILIYLALEIRQQTAVSLIQSGYLDAMLSGENLNLYEIPFCLKEHKFIAFMNFVIRSSIRRPRIPGRWDNALAVDNGLQLPSIPW